MSAQLHQFKRLQYTKAIAECFTLQLIPKDVPEDILLDLPADIEPELELLLHTYENVFHIPTSLPHKDRKIMPFHWYQVLYPKICSPIFTVHLTYDLKSICIYSYSICIHADIS